MTLLYLDASALVKLVLSEPGSEVLDAFVGEGDVVTSEIAILEVLRAVRRASIDVISPDEDTIRRDAEGLLQAIALHPLDRDVLLEAGALRAPFLRSLDAIHLATALRVGRLDAFVSYDERQAAAARLEGLRTISPGQV